MKVVALVVSTVVITALTMVAIGALVLLLPNQSGAVLLLGSLALTPMAYGPALIGSILTYFDPKKSPESRRSFTRWAVGIGVFEVAGAIGVVIATVLGRGPWLLPVVFIATSAVLIVLAWAISLPLRRYDQRQEAKRPAWTAISRDQITRKVLAMVITFVVVFVVLAIVLTVVIPAKHGFGGALGLGVTFALDFGFLGAAIAGIAGTLSVTRQVRSILSRDLGTARQLRRVVLRGKPDQLPEDLRVSAARYASVAPVMLSFNLSYTTLILGGLVISDLVSLANSFDSTSTFLDFASIGIFALVLVLIYPLQISYIVRARRYAREHADLLDADQPTPTAAG